MTDSATAVDEAELHEIRILGWPLDVAARATEHHEGLMREFALLSNPHPDQDLFVPARLTGIMKKLRHQYSGLTQTQSDEMDEAMARGIATIDVTYRLPAAVAPAVRDLDALLDEADDFCRSGELLTMATPPDLVRYRKWFLGEFARQLAGHEPTPWSEYQGQSPMGAPPTGGS